MEEREFEVMRTYARAWQTDIVMYHLFGYPLWFPVSLRQASFYMVGLVLIFLVSRIIPTIKEIPFIGDPVALFGAYPFLIMKFFTKLTLDGKPPHVYFKDQIIYFMEDKKFNIYKPIKMENKVIYSSKIGYRILKLISSVDYRFLVKEGK